MLRRVSAAVQELVIGPLLIMGPASQQHDFTTHAVTNFDQHFKQLQSQGGLSIA